MITDPALVVRLDQALAGVDGHVSVAVKDLGSGRGAALDGDREMPAASLYKLTVLYSVFEAGLNMGEELPITEEARSYDSGSMELGVGETLSVAEALERMVTISDNTSAVMLGSRVGSNRVNANIAALGMESTHYSLERMTTSALDMLHLLDVVAQGKAVSTAASADMLHLLLRQRVNDRLPRLLPGDVQMAHKTGNLPGTVNDVGIVYGPSSTVAVAVLISETTDETAAATAIARVAQTVYAYFEDLAEVARAAHHPARADAAHPAGLARTEPGDADAHADASSPRLSRTSCPPSSAFSHPVTVAVRPSTAVPIAHPRPPAPTQPRPPPRPVPHPATQAAAPRPHTRPTRPQLATPTSTPAHTDRTKLLPRISGWQCPNPDLYESPNKPGRGGPCQPRTPPRCAVPQLPRPSAASVPRAPCRSVHAACAACILSAELDSALPPVPDPSVARGALRTSIALGAEEGLRWRTLTSRQLLEHVDGLAVDLAERGIASGDRVVLWAPSGLRAPTYLFALWKLGAIVVPFDREMNPQAATAILATVEPRCVILGFEDRPVWAPADAVDWWQPAHRRSARAAAV